MNAHHLIFEANRIRNEIMDSHPEWADYIRPVHFQVSSRLTRCAGKAFVWRNLIQLSLAFYASDENFAAHFNETVRHELAHVIARKRAAILLRPIKPHGLEWYSVARAIGSRGERCHALELADGFTKRRTQQRKAAECSRCHKAMQLGPTQYRRHMQHVSMGLPGYSHKKCP